MLLLPFEGGSGGYFRGSVICFHILHMQRFKGYTKQIGKTVVEGPET